MPDDDKRIPASGPPSPVISAESPAEPVRTRDPAFLFYSADFLSGTYALSDADAGRLVRLLCLQHQRGRLDEREIIRSVKRLDSPVMGFFTRGGDGLYYNERLERETERRRDYAASRRRNRMGSEEKNSSSSSLSEDHMSDHMTTHMCDHMSVHMVTETETVTKTGTGTGAKKRYAANPKAPRPAPTAESLENVKRLLEKLRDS